MQKFFKNKKNACPQCLKHSFCRRGFTLVETLVAISIFSISILGLLSVLASGITSTTYAKNKIIAGYLAQEGIEYVRNMRDTFVLYDYDSNGNPIGWASFINKITPCETTKGCFFDDSSVPFSIPSNMAMKNLTLNPCSSATCPNGLLLYNSSTGEYGYANNGTSSGFVRKVWMIPNNLNPSNEIQIFSVVSWTQGSGNYNITFSENLFNWVQ
jgi:prepilin-type N-terminal cleavage/methylation domain-containing protein